MPDWVAWIVAAAALVTAVGVLWVKVIHPLIRFTATVEVMYPLLLKLTETFRDVPHAFAVLDQIVAQFRTDSGSSARDLLNRLETTAVANKQAAEVLKVGVEASRLLAEQDRAQLQRLIILLDRLTVKVDAGDVVRDRIEAHSRGVAAVQDRMERGTEQVAADLAASHQRADDAEGQSPGDAADAAARSPGE